MGEEYATKHYGILINIVDKETVAKVLESLKKEGKIKEYSIISEDLALKLIGGLNAEFEEKVLKSVNKIPTSTNAISKKCKITYYTVKKVLNELSDKGLIVRNDFYRVSNKKGSIVWYKN